MLTKDTSNVSTTAEKRIAGDSENESEMREAAAPEIDLLDAAIVVAAHKRTVVRVVLFAAVASVVVSLLLPSKYTGQTNILPPQQNQSIASALLNQLGPMAALAGRDMGGGRGSSDLFVAMLKSRTVEEAVIREFGLMSVYGKKTMQDTRKKLESNTSIFAGKEGIISISFEDKDPSRAAAVANGFVDQLFGLNKTLAVTEAGQRRVFFEQQLQKEKDDLADAEVALKQTQESTGLITLDSQSRVIIESVARLQAQVAAKEIQLKSMRAFATVENPDYLKGEQELHALQSQLEKGESSQDVRRGSVQIATGRIPEAGLEYIRRLRNVKYHEAIFELLARQFEIAKIDEAKSSVIQVVDKAVPPEKKSGPPRAIIVVLSTVLAFICVIAWILFRDSRQRSSNPEQVEKLHRITELLRGRG
jgi:uncharacterized protein involved in exopolysaccharide biosynthesis